MTREKIEEIGSMLRLITPALIAIIGTMIVVNLGEINKKFDSLNNRFDSFLVAQSSIDKRVLRLEYKIYGDHDLK